jgi:hypothetical protein
LFACERVLTCHELPNGPASSQRQLRDRFWQWAIERVSSLDETFATHLFS